MAIDNPNVIDFISISPENKVALTISDHFEWNEDDEHLLLLQNKINSYLEVIESKQIFEIYPDANDKEIVIQAYLKYPPNQEGKLFLDEIIVFLKSKNYEFNYFIEN
jgi:hypothetical protein